MSQGDPRGSVWRRWEPHIHAPGTLLNDQYRGADAWERYLTAVEQSAPAIEALGVTDYWTLDTYERVVEAKERGRLSGVRLIFPNVELRFGIATDSGSAINAHLLVSPDDPDHVDKARHFLQFLTFDYGLETYRCHVHDLQNLGRRVEPSLTDAQAALRVGANQFKIMPADLSRAFERSAWARENILVGVAAKSGDGTSGLAKDSTFRSLRREIERMASVIFSARPGDRDFFLGRKDVSREELEREWGGRKVCLHGSDAHSIERVGRPAQDRYSWLKGDASFETLRQACMEPDSRATIGSAPPEGPQPHKVIESVEFFDCPWLDSAKIPLNPGLVAIIGARGSGKTALADIIAFAGQSDSPMDNRQSFLNRASRHLRGQTYALNWLKGEASSRTFSRVIERLFCRSRGSLVVIV